MCSFSFIDSSVRRTSSKISLCRAVLPLPTDMYVTAGLACSTMTRLVALHVVVACGIIASVVPLLLLLSCSVHQHFQLADFKKIFWMEYMHRMWGRAIGVAFAVPAAVFAYKGWLNRGMKIRVGIFGSLIVFQVCIVVNSEVALISLCCLCSCWKLLVVGIRSEWHRSPPPPPVYFTLPYIPIACDLLLKR